MEKENAKIEQRLRESEETERALNLRTMELESQLARQDSKMRHIEAAYNAQVYGMFFRSTFQWNIVLQNII